jgi:hypothetical protein
MITTSRLQVTGVTGGPLRITGASLVNGAYELATAGGADYELQTERQVMLDNILFIPGIGFDSDALAYIKAVEVADGQALEREVRNAINQFVLGCKSDGIWNAIKASCILAGARTLDGALVPLKGSAPTNFNFVSGDYNRETGLIGNATTKYLNSNRNSNADPQNSNHNAVYVTEAQTGALGQYIGTTNLVAPRNNLGENPTTPDVFARNRTNGVLAISGTSTGLLGHSRSTSSNFIFRFNGTNATANEASGTPEDANVELYRRGTGNYANARLAFYSIGESLDLALLDARVTTLINTFGAVI